MKTLFKTTALLGLAALGIFYSLPGQVSAAAALNRAVPAANDFCTAFNSRSVNLNAKLQSKEADITADSDQNKLGLKKGREKIQNELESNRLKNDQKLDERINALAVNAKTEKQKQAVKIFKSEVETAVLLRRNSIDAAIKNFQKGLDLAIDDFVSKIQASLKAYKNSVAAAENKARNDCGKKDAEAIKQTFTQSLKDAKGRFDTDRQTTKLDGTLEDLKKVRDSAIQKTNQDFAAQINRASAKLKNALK